MRVVSARAEQNDATDIGERQDSAPPTSTTSAALVRMYSIALAMAWPLEAQAVTVHSFGPVKPNSMAREPAAAFGIIMAMSDGLTKRGPRFSIFVCSSSHRPMPPMPLPMTMPTRVGSGSDGFMPASARARVAAA